MKARAKEHRRKHVLDAAPAVSSGGSMARLANITPERFQNRGN